MMWQAHILGEFPDRSTDSLIPLDWIVAAQRRTLEPKEHAPRILGVDVARYGEDRTVILERRGPVVRCRSVSQQEDTMQTAGRVAQALRETGASAAHVDVIGVGAGVVDRLREQGLPVVPVNVGEAAWDSERFTNRRAECFWALRERFEAEAIDLDPADEELAAQLSALKYKFDSRGRILIESKDDMRKRGMASPDQADALMLACLPESLVTFDPAAVAAF